MDMDKKTERPGIKFTDALKVNLLSRFKSVSICVHPWFKTLLPDAAGNLGFISFPPRRRFADTA